MKLQQAPALHPTQVSASLTANGGLLFLLLLYLSDTGSLSLPSANRESHSPLSIPFQCQPGCFQWRPGHCQMESGGGAVRNFLYWTCWKPSKPPLHPSSFDELSTAPSALSLPIEFQKTPRAKMRMITESGIWSGI